MIGGFGGGLILLGIGFIILDFFMARIAPGIKRPGFHGLSDQQMLISIAKPQERRRMKFAVLSYEAALTHRMRRGGLVVIAVGLFMLVGAIAYQMFTKSNL